MTEKMTPHRFQDGEVFHLHQGHAPLLVSLPHVGTELPAGLAERLVPRALQLEDTDWHLETLYQFAHELGASVLVPRYSRYAIDLNRPPHNEPMYPGANNTALCPTTFFSGDSLYLPGQEPDNQEVQDRVHHLWAPYHEALQSELRRLQSIHGQVVLFDAHSICESLPWLFEGRLPQLNLGTVSGGSCSPVLKERLTDVLEHQCVYSQVVDGRFKGGFITRNYGRPETHVHAVQLEMGWSCYLHDDAPWRLDGARVSQIQPLLKRLLITCRDWAQAQEEQA